MGPAGLRVPCAYGRMRSVSPVDLDMMRYACILILWSTVCLGMFVNCDQHNRGRTNVLLILVRMPFWRNSSPCVPLSRPYKKVQATLPFFGGLGLIDSAGDPRSATQEVDPPGAEHRSFGQRRAWSCVTGFLLASLRSFGSLASTCFPRSTRGAGGSEGPAAGRGRRPTLAHAHASAR